MIRHNTYVTHSYQVTSISDQQFLGYCTRTHTQTDRTETIHCFAASPAWRVIKRHCEVYCRSVTIHGPLRCNPRSISGVAASLPRCALHS